MAYNGNSFAENVVSFSMRTLLELEKKNKTKDDDHGDGSHDGEVSKSSGFILASIGISLVILLEIIVFGLVLPVFGGRILKVSDRTKEMLVGLSNAFAGGVFLGGALVHLLAESAETFIAVLPNNDNAIAIICTFTGLGYLVVFMLERVALASQHAEAHSHGDSSHTHSHSHSHKDKDKVKDEEKELEMMQMHLQEKGDEEKGELAVDEEKGEVEEEKMPPEEDSRKNSVASFALTAVLFLHTFISGFALSLRSSMSTMLGLGLAILLHKWVEAFAWGVAMHKLNVPMARRISLISFYSLSTLVGVALGLILTYAIVHTQAVMDMLQAVGGAIAAGTFLYVAAVDILAEEFANTNNKWKKGVACMIGFGAMAFLKFLLDQ